MTPTIPHPSFWRPTLLALACSLALQGAQAQDSSSYAELRTRWQQQLTGAGRAAPTLPEWQAAATELADKAELHWQSMNPASTTPGMWPDLQSSSDASVLTSHYARLLLMARAYASPGSRLQGRTDLAAAIQGGLAWMHANRYRPGLARYGNWWDWEIGAPQALTSILTVMHAALSATERERDLASVDFYVPDATYRGNQPSLEETGANRLDKALIIGVRGALGDSDERLRHARDAISQTLPDVTQGDGFYADGSFIQHNYVAYTGSYGLVMLDSLSRLLLLLNGSLWAPDDPELSHVYDWTERAFRPLVRDGAMADSVRGRAIARRSSSNHSAGRSLMGSLLRLAEGAPAAQALPLKEMVKGWLQRNRYLGPSCYSGQTLSPESACAKFSLHEISLLHSLQADTGITPAPERAGAQVFASMDRAVLRHADFSFDLSLFSNRISAYESGNGENLRPWWTGMGISSLHNADQQAFDGDYWATVDLLRLAGTTTDRSSAALKNWALIKNTSNWVGGAQLEGRYAIATLDFGALNVTGSSLKGKKAWFLFGDKIFALGAAISSGNSLAVETVVENRKLNPAGSNALTMGGQLQPSTPGWSQSFSAAAWAHLAGSQAGADIGYVFPDRPTVQALRETRSGNWKAIKSQEAADTVSANYLSLAIPHGLKPTAANYSYVILPGRSAAQTAAFAAQPALKILARSTDLLAVQDSSLGLVGANFLTNGSKTLNLDGKALLTSSAKASVLMRESGDELALSVADPTQVNTGSITLDLQRAASAVLASSPGITVLRLAPTVQLQVNVAQSAGRSFEARFRLQR
ncbi:polysaccharide lyase 8 family protein [Paucibacter sp. DJ2R-2]|uniref:polysaccharide lyase 8 family protein n=1 Tax=Paucibacter sp. DJ2R-2 TaxID=2893558 RepID=UPI0021E4393B|nr:polysaccharide lyase 8 family protein [Paucibacter sp. DJ2R-2]MCV2421410.1 polysaccharide lyase 8 family protein [Paucibacter sp. DJ4R-1]MCV2438092.1 polysaccharide lyase 8 family protein [Paucibacter sp. DJ2R-2]